MRRLTAWIGGVAGGLVAYRFWRRHRADEGEAEPEAAVDARAAELRSKLAESRAAEPVEDEPPTEPQAEEHPPGPTEPESIEQRRRRVHEEGRATIDEMHPEHRG